MEKQKIVQYFELYNRFTENQVLYEKGNMKFTQEELSLIKEGNKFVNENELYKEILKKPLDERKQEVERMKQEIENENEIVNESEDMKAIKETFGFDIQNIENKHLENGVEIFKFYAPKLERVVVLENRQDKSLSEMLKEKQAFDDKFQTSNDINNTNDMLEEERQKDNVELKMIYVSEVDSHLNELTNMKPEDRKKLNYIIKNADQLGVKKLNLKNLIYLDQDDNIREVTYDSEKDMINDQDPNTLNNNVEQVNTSDRIDESLSQDEQRESLKDDFEDKPEEVENIEKWEDLNNDIQTQVVTYKEFPELLEALDEEERKRWQHYIELYDEHEKERYRAPEMPAKVKVLTPNGHANGTVDVILISIITLITMAAVALVAYQFLK